MDIKEKKELLQKTRPLLGEDAGRGDDLIRDLKSKCTCLRILIEAN